MKKHSKIKISLSLNLLIIVMMVGFSMFSQARVTVEQQTQSSIERNLNDMDAKVFELRGFLSSWNSKFPALQQDIQRIFDYLREEQSTVKELRERLRQCENQQQ